VDACGVCGGSGVDSDADGICDAVDACTDQSACNYDDPANEACATVDACGVCGGSGVDADSDGICDDADACTDQSACNYDDPANAACATVDAVGVCGGSCLADDNNNGICDDAEPFTCQIPSACNYDATGAQVNNSLCEWLSCAGCMNPIACNYDVTATVSFASSCTFPAFSWEDCDGACLPEADLNNNQICDPFEYAGCTDLNAINYNPAANFDDGSCFLVLVGCVIPAASNYDLTATVQGIPVLDYCNFALTAPTTEGIPETCTIDSACNFNEEGPCEFESCLGCNNATACNFDASALYNDGSCEWLTCVGCMNATACDYDATATIAATCDYISCVGCTDSNADNFDAGATQDNGACIISGCGLADACNYDATANNPDGSCDYSCYGCTDNSSCNYNASATVDDGSCEFTSCQGCTDNTACNYDPTATQSDGSCTYPPAGYDDCAGTVCTDINNNGVCDFNESPVLGCLNSTACNYDSTANTSDPNNPCTFLVFSGFSSVTAASSNAAADGSVTPIIGGTGGSGTYFLKSLTLESQVSNEGTKVYLFTDVMLSGNLAASSWNTLPAGRYKFGLVDDVGCQAEGTHRVLIPALAP
jgi:hypothetical protein